jgi:precorrin-6A/cobalt-precorrin-6A reductase
LTILVLGGTAESHAVSAALGPRALVSLAHAIETRPYASPVRRGGFGGAEAERAWMVQAGIRAVIDASHPFASAISSRTAQIAGDLDLPYVRLLRPEWRPGPGDHWVTVPDARAVAGVLPADATTLLAVGAAHLGDFAGLKGRIFLRSLVPARDPPFDLAGAVLSPPLDAAGEAALMSARGITHLVLRNAGGDKTGRIEAARALGIAVVMIARPPRPTGVAMVETVEEAVQWADNLDL